MVSPGNVAELDDSVSLGGFFLHFGGKLWAALWEGMGLAGIKPHFFNYFGMGYRARGVDPNCGLHRKCGNHTPWLWGVYGFRKLWFWRVLTALTPVDSSKKLLGFYLS